MNDNPTEEISEYEVTDRHIDARLLDVHTSFPARVESFDPKGFVDVVPCLNRSLQDGQGNYSTETLPKLARVPVCAPRCGAYFISFPIKPGDYVLVVCAQRNISNWRASGDQGDPGDVGMHTLDGAVAIPGVFPDSKAIQNGDANNMVLGNDSEPGARIVITETGIEIGGNADHVALAAKVKAWFDAFNTAVSGWTPVAQDGGAALKLALAKLYGGMPSTDVASTNVKAT